MAQLENLLGPRSARDSDKDSSPSLHVAQFQSLRMASAAPTPEQYGPKKGVISPLPAAERGVAVVMHHSPDGKYICYPNGSNVVVRSLEVRQENCCMGSRGGQAMNLRGRLRQALDVCLHPPCSGTSFPLPTRRTLLSPLSTQTMHTR